MTDVWERLQKTIQAQATVGIVVGVLVAALVIGVREAGLLEAAELLVYDWMVRAESRHDGSAPRVVVIGITEADIRNVGHWPITDALMAYALDRIADLQPRAIGVDVYRDLPVPPGRDTLNTVLTRHPNIVMVMTFGHDGKAGVPAPMSVVGPERVGFNDLLPDRDGTVRRGLLFLGAGEDVVYSLPLRLALLYLQHEGIEPAPDPIEPSYLRLSGTTLRPVRSNDGMYIRADARGYQVWLDFRHARAFSTIYTLSDLLNGALTREMIADRIVLFGAMAESVPDLVPIPTGLGGEQDPRGVFGVLLHALITDQLLRVALDGQAPLSSFPEAVEGGWIALWAAVGGVLGVATRSVWRSLVLTTSGVLLIGGLGEAAFLARWWIPVLPPILSFVIAGGLMTAWLASQEKRSRALLMQLFSRHVSPEVAETIWQHRDQFLHQGRPRPQDATATVLFVDFQGYTGVSERLAGPALMDWMNTYMEAMARQVMAHGGFVDDYFGDALKADFGVPLTRTDEAGIREDANRALACALGMVGELKALNRRHRDEGRLAARLRIGICTGPVVVGSQGSAERLKYTVLGDTVNVAFRLQQFEKQHWVSDDEQAPCRVLVSDSTAQYVTGRYPLERMGEMILDGKAKPVTVYRLLGSCEPAADADRPEVQR